MLPTVFADGGLSWVQVFRWLQLQTGPRWQLVLQGLKI